MKRIMIALIGIMAGIFFSQSVQGIVFKGLNQGTVEQFLTEINYPPEVSQSSLSGTWNEGQKVVLGFSAKDKDGDSLKMSIIAGPIGGTITSLGQGNYEFSWQTNHDDAGTYIFGIKVEDNHDKDKIITVTLTIIDVSQGIKIISYCPGTSTIMPEGSWTMFSIEAKSLAGLPLSYSWTFGTTNFGVTATGTYLSFNYEDAGTYTLIVKVTNGTTSVSHQWNVLVVDVNRAPTINITSITGSKVNKPVVIEVAGGDPDNDPLTWGYSGPSGSTLTPVAGGAKWEWLPTIVGDYSITIYASDGRGGIGSATTALQIAP
jgi:hypothetical protein